MRDRLLTILLSVATTYGITNVTGGDAKRHLEVDRLVVREELIVSDTGVAWEQGFEAQQIPRGIYATSLGTGTAGLWVRGRLIKGEIDDPFDDRFHALERDGSLRRSPGHISWNIWLDDAWRQLAIIQGEGVEPTELPNDQWNGGNHPGRLRFQSFRVNHSEPLTDAVIGQGMMSLGGGGFGGGGLTYPSDVLELWGGTIRTHDLPRPSAPTIVKHEGGTEHQYALYAVGPQGVRSARSEVVSARGRATLQWDSVVGADAYVVERDGRLITDEIRIEGSAKQWADNVPE